MTLLSCEDEAQLYALVDSCVASLTSHLSDPHLHERVRHAVQRAVPARWRAAVVAAGADELLDALARRPATAIDVGDAGTPRVRGDGQRRIAFVFSGQGSEWAGMGATLMAGQPAFRRAIAACQQAMAPYVTWSLADALHGGPAWSSDIDVVQPCIFAMQVGLIELWRELGVQADGVVGHSIGEVAAAYASGALSLPAAAQVICRQSLLFRDARGQGTLLYVELASELASELLHALAPEAPARAWVAIEHARAATVVAGAQPLLAAMVVELERRQVGWRWVPVDVPAHTPGLDRACQQLEQELAAAPLVVCAPRTPFYSVATGAPAQQPLDAAYWRQSSTTVVRFVATIDRMVADGFDSFVEISPHPLVLGSLEELVVERCGPHSAVGSLRRRASPRRSLLRSAGKLFCHGVAVASQVALSDGAELLTLSAGSAPTGPRPFGARQASVSLQAGSLAAEVRHATGARRSELVAAFVRDQLAAALGVSAASISLDTPLRELGLDSVMALGLRTQLSEATGLRLPATVAWSHPSGRALAAHLVASLGVPGAPEVPRAPMMPAAPMILAVRPEHAASGSLDDQLLAEVLRTETLLRGGHGSRAGR